MLLLIHKISPENRLAHTDVRRCSPPHSLLFGQRSSPPDALWYRIILSVTALILYYCLRFFLFREQSLRPSIRLVSYEVYRHIYTIVRLSVTATAALYNNHNNNIYYYVDDIVVTITDDRLQHCGRYIASTSSYIIILYNII